MPGFSFKSNFSFFLSHFTATIQKVRKTFDIKLHPHYPHTTRTTRTPPAPTAPTAPTAHHHSAHAATLTWPYSSERFHLTWNRLHPHACSRSSRRELLLFFFTELITLSSFNSPSNEVFDELRDLPVFSSRLSFRSFTVVVLRSGGNGKKNKEQVRQRRPEASRLALSLNSQLKESL